MLSETIRFLICATLAVLVLFGTAALLTGCEAVTVAKCLALDNTNKHCD